MPDPLSKTYEKSARIIADAYYESYRSQDPKAALEIIKNNSKLIKEQLAKRDPQKNSHYVKDGIRDGLKKMVFDIWLAKHSGKYKDDKSKNELFDLACLQCFKRF